MEALAKKNKRENKITFINGTRVNMVMVKPLIIE